MESQFPVTLSLILVIFTCIISYQGFNDNHMRSKFSMHPASVKEFGQWFRLLTSGFLHKDFMHLGVNMYVLWMFGENLEFYFMQDYFFGEMWGRLIYVLIYLGAVVVSSLPSYFKHQDNQYYSALGASGGVSAILFALIIIDPWTKISFLFLPFFDFPFIVFGVLYLVYETYMSKKGGDLIGHDAHIAGAVFGMVALLVVSYIFNPNLLDFFYNQLISGPIPN